MKTNPSLSPDYTKLPPQVPELEGVVMGALLLESNAFEQIEDLLRPDDFYQTAHQIIFQAILNLRSRRHPVDMLTVTQELTRMKLLEEVGGPWYISQLTSAVASTSHLRHHALIVKDRAEARELIRITSDIAARAYDPAENTDELKESLEMQLTALATRSGHPASLTMPELLRQAVSKAERLQQLHEQGKAVAIPTGLPELDKALYGGCHPADLIIIGARPSMGKTQLALSLAKAAAMQGYHSLFCSIEMGGVALTNRYILEEEAIDPAHLRTGEMTPEEWEALDRQVAHLWNLHIHIAADPQICFLHNIRSEARRLKRLGQLDQLFVDYLSLVQVMQKFERRYLEVGHITKEFKNLAKELDVPVIVLAQLNRPLKGVKVEEPGLTDLRESGEIEQHADVVAFIHKPDYYIPGAVDRYGKSWKNRGKILIAKQRDGIARAEITFRHDPCYKKIMED